MQGVVRLGGLRPFSDLVGDSEAESAGRAFAEEVLRCRLDTCSESGTGASVVAAHLGFSRGSTASTRSTARCYVVERRDALCPAGDGAFAVMRYDDDGGTAAVACETTGRTEASFPFETIRDGVQRDRLRDVLDFPCEVGLK